MKKISILYKKDPNDLGRVINEINPENEWVFTHGIPTRKFDGTACSIIKENLHKRYDCKIDKVTGKYKKPIPEGAIPCQEADKVSGHHPHWVKCDRSNPADRYHWEAFDRLIKETPPEFIDGTYELCGEKVQGNPEKIKGYKLIPHGDDILPITDFSFDGLKAYFHTVDIEGIVFHHKEDDRMCKIRKSDFGIKR